MWKTALMCLTLVMLQFGAGAAMAETRIALVIGNGDYQFADHLKTPKADAAAVAAALKAQGFRIFATAAQTNLSVADMVRVISEFGAESREADQAVIYFAGYGVDIKGKDYLLSVDINPDSESGLVAQSIELDGLIRAAAPANGQLIVLLDAAYNNPLRAESTTRGLARPNLSGNVIMELAAEPGKIAAAGAKHSPFAAGLLRTLALIRGDLADALLPASEAVAAATGGRQKPRFLSGLRAADEGAASVAETENRGAANTPTAGAANTGATIADEDRSRGASGGGTGSDNVIAEGAPYTVVKVFYATDRKHTGKTDPKSIYGGERGGLVYGSCDVSLPKDHRIGELEVASITHFEFSEDPKKHVVLMNTSEMPADTFYKSVSDRIASRPGRNAFIFVHGYYVSFEDAARRTAQMSYDLRFDGAPVFFSWPSQGSFLGYLVDETNVDFSRTDLKRFIKDFVEKSSAENIYLIAHSMGNRTLTSALGDLFLSSPEIKNKIREVILAAPDIDAQVFKEEIAPKIVSSGVLVTMYASSNDWALKASKLFHGYPRSGDGGSGLTLASGVNTIDSSDVDTDMFGHSYYAESSSIIADIFAIFNGQYDPSRRPQLKEVDVPDGKYWKMRRKLQ